MAEIAGYVLRIMSDYWVNHVFDMAIYYTNLRRRWKSDQSIIFIHKTMSVNRMSFPKKKDLSLRSGKKP
jgi:hypothetical protein